MECDLSDTVDKMFDTTYHSLGLERVGRKKGNDDEGVIQGHWVKYILDPNVWHSLA